jgi:RIO kinase 1
MVYRGIAMSSAPLALQRFVDAGVISAVVRLIQSGKESDIYLTQRVCDGRVFYFAAKVHTGKARRAFKRDQVYRAGWCLEARIQRAVDKGSRFGRELVDAFWVTQEFDALKRLWRHGANVPTPILRRDNVILMVYLGDPDAPAPKLCEIALNAQDAAQAFDELVSNLRILLELNLVHGDLSPFNVLYWNGHIWIIDLPQSVDLYQNPHAVDLLYRDVQRVCTYFQKHGVDVTPAAVFRQVLGLSYLPGKTYQDLLMVAAEPERDSLSPCTHAKTKTGG